MTVMWPIHLMLFGDLKYVFVYCIRPERHLVFGCLHLLHGQEKKMKRVSVGSFQSLQSIPRTLSDWASLSSMTKKEKKEVGMKKSYFWC